MLFKDYHLPMIRSGSKTVTRREWADNYPGPNVGTVVAAKTEMLKPDDECGCFIRITGKRREPLGETTDESARREGDYEDVEDFRQGYEEVYGEGAWDPEKVVDVIEFEYVGDERPPASDTEQSKLGRVRCWDNEDCPRDGCEGELQQQDRINVMCLSCDEVFAHYKNDDNHILADSSDETVARKARMLPDGGRDEDASSGIERVDELEQGDLVEFEASAASGIPQAVVTASLLDPPFPPDDDSDDQIPEAVTIALENPESKAKWNFRQEIDPDTGDLAGEIEVSVKACIDIRHPPRYRWQDRGTLESCEVVGEREVAGLVE